MKPNELTIEALKQELQQALDQITKNADPMDILPILRKYVPDTNEYLNFQHLIDTVSESNLDYYRGGLPSLNIIFTHGSFNELNKQEVLNWEPDNVYFSYNPTQGETIIQINDELITVLAFIMLHDCTNCCNALKFINLSPYGLFAAGDVSMTYHS